MVEYLTIALIIVGTTYFVFAGYRAIAQSLDAAVRRKKNKFDK